MKYLITVFLAVCSTLAFSEGAAVIKEFGCSGFVPNDTFDGLPSLGGVYTDEQTQSVVTPSGNTKLSCHFEHDVPLKRATSAKGFLCGTHLGLTSASKMTATPGGAAHLTCWVKANSE